MIAFKALAQDTLPYIFLFCYLYARLHHTHVRIWKFACFLGDVHSGYGHTVIKETGICMTVLYKVLSIPIERLLSSCLLFKVNTIETPEE